MFLVNINILVYIFGKSSVLRESINILILKTTEKLIFTLPSYDLYLIVSQN